MSPKQLTALRLLAQNSDGLYGSEMVALSEGRLTRGTVYSMLERMISEGFVREVEEPASASLQLARTRHYITAKGKRAYAEFLSEHREMTVAFHPQSA
jgi:DNA-binding PadR family transcriptional regulator